MAVDMNKIGIRFSPLSERIVLARFGKDPNVALDTRDAMNDFLQVLVQFVGVGYERQFGGGDEQFVVSLRLAQERLKEVEIKPLDWRVFCGTSGNSDAQSPLGEYVVQNEDGIWKLYLPGQEDPTGSGYFTRDEAEAAGQADYEKKIRSVLLLPAHPSVNKGDS